MRIGIDCRTLLNPQSGERAGVGHYTFHVVRALLDVDHRNAYVLFFEKTMPHEVALGFQRPNVRIRYFPFSPYRRYLPFAYSHLLTAAAIRKEKLDVFHAPANVMPLLYRRPTVVTIHDLAIYQHPEWFPVQPVSTKVLVPQTLKRAERIIAVSAATKKDLTLLMNVPAKKITVVPEAADTSLLNLDDKNDDIRKEYGLPKKYVLYVGTIEPRKNIDRLLAAWRRLATERPAVTRTTTLVLAGGVGARSEQTFQNIRAMQQRSLVRYLGYIPHNHKIQLLKSATVFAFPSLYEGFGLPVLEALQLGVPTLTSRTSSLPEVAGQAAVLVDPENEKEIAAGLAHIITSPAVQRKLSLAGKKQAKNFDWDRTARATLAVYRSAVK